MLPHVIRCTVSARHLSQVAKTSQALSCREIRAISHSILKPHGKEWDFL